MAAPPALLALVLAGGLLAGCQGSAPPGPTATPPADAGSRAAAALARGDYARAADLYRRALEEAQDRVDLHFGLGTAASHLARRADTVREFRWVLAHGAPDSEEVRLARRWLEAAGAAPRLDPAPAAAAPPEEPARQPGQARLSGQAVFGEPGQEPLPMSRMMLILKGLPDSPTQSERHQLRTDEQGRFVFPSVVPGPYVLTNRVAGDPIWRLRVELGPSQDRSLDLTPANSVQVRDDFPSRG